MCSFDWIGFIFSTHFECFWFFVEGESVLVVVGGVNQNHYGNMLHVIVRKTSGWVYSIFFFQFLLQSRIQCLIYVSAVFAWSVFSSFCLIFFAFCHFCSFVILKSKLSRFNPQIIVRQTSSSLSLFRRCIHSIKAQLTCSVRCSICFLRFPTIFSLSRVFS